MDDLFKNFNLQKEIKNLVDCYLETPFNWYINELGIYKFNGELFSFCHYVGQGIVEPIYNGRVEYIIYILDCIKNYFNIPPKVKYYTKIEKDKYISFICDNVLDTIKEFEIKV